MELRSGQGVFSPDGFAAGRRSGIRCRDLEKPNVDFTPCFRRLQMPKVNFALIFSRKTVICTTWADLGGGPQIPPKREAATEEHFLKKN